MRTLSYRPLFSVEQTDCFKPYGYGTFAVANKIIDPPGQCKSNWDTFCFLAGKLGFEEDYFKQTAEDALEDLLSQSRKGSGAAVRRTVAVFEEKAARFLQIFADHCDFKSTFREVYDRK